MLGGVTDWKKKFNSFFYIVRISNHKAKKFGLYDIYKTFFV